MPEKFTLKKYEQLINDKINKYFYALDMESDLRELDRLMNRAKTPTEE